MSQEGFEVAGSQSDNVRLTAYLSDGQDEVLDHNPALEKAVRDASRDSKVEALITGAGPFYSEFTNTTTEDLERADKIAFPITLLILVIAFASLVAAGVPILLALISWWFPLVSFR